MFTGAPADISHAPAAHVGNRRLATGGLADRPLLAHTRLCVCETLGGLLAGAEGHGLTRRRATRLGCAEEEKSDREAHLPAEHPSSSTATRVPPSHVRPCRPRHHPSSPAQGKAQAFRLIPGVRGRRSFVELDRHGRRASAGPLRISFCADATPSPRLAFAIDRRVGTAVARNRARRRLRHLVSALAAERPELVGPGDYLIGIRRADFTSEEARRWLIQALEKLRRPPA